MYEVTPRYQKRFGSNLCDFNSDETGAMLGLESRPQGPRWGRGQCSYVRLDT